MIFTFPEPRHLGISLATLRQRHPLVHCITNQVASNLTANALLCVGASPLMAEDEDEVAALSPDALLINLGMQTPARMRSARVAVTGARQTRHTVGARPRCSRCPFVPNRISAGTGCVPPRGDQRQCLRNYSPRWRAGRARHGRDQPHFGRPSFGRGACPAHRCHHRHHRARGHRDRWPPDHNRNARPPDAREDHRPGMRGRCTDCRMPNGGDRCIAGSDQRTDVVGPGCRTCCGTSNRTRLTASGTARRAI